MAKIIQYIGMMFLILHTLTPTLFHLFVCSKQFFEVFYELVKKR